jgi:hypothetical protein
MQGHSIVSFFGPGLGMCGRCERVVDVYEWTEPCETLAAVDGEPAAPGTRRADAVLAS